MAPTERLRRLYPISTPKDDSSLKQIEGNYDKFVGKAQERYGDQKEELLKWADQWHQKAAADATKDKHP